MFIYILLVLLVLAAVGYCYFDAKINRREIASRLNHEFADWCYETNDDSEITRRVNFYLDWDVNTALKLNGPKCLAEILEDYYPIY